MPRNNVVLKYACHVAMLSQLTLEIFLVSEPFTVTQGNDYSQHF